MNSPFDSGADKYDDMFTRSEIGKKLRKHVWRYLDRSFSKKHDLDILELNCGTGEDAIYLAGKGHNVTATDLSRSMLNVAEEKVKLYNFENRIKVQSLDINSISADKWEEKFDIVFSDFGGMNCLSPKLLKTFADVIPSILKQEGRFIAVVMSDICLWELLYFMSRFKFTKALRRRGKGSLLVPYAGTEVETWYYSPGSFAELFIDDFSVVTSMPLGLFLPPTYMESFFKNKIKLLSFLERLENVFGRFSILSRFADHFILELKVNR